MIPGAIAGGAQLQLALRWPHLSVGLEGRFDAPASGDLSGATQVRTSLAGGALSGCGHFGVAYGCGVFAAAALIGSGEELVNAQQAVLPYVAGGPRLGVQFGQGVLEEEAHALRVRAFTAQGQADRARAAAHAFLERYPGSLLESVVKAAIASLPGAGSRP